MKIRVAWTMALLWLALDAWAFAGGVREVRKQAVASMLVTGSVVVDTQGRLNTLTLDKEERLPPAVAKLIRRQAQHWRFEPVLIDGKPVNAKSPMSVRVIAQRANENDYAIRLGGASFGQGAPDVHPEAGLRGDQLTPPRYPDKAARMGVSGTAYVIAKVGRDGKVQDAIVEQVNLQVVAREREMEDLRRLLGDNALAASRKWTFHAPTRGEEADKPYWTVRVPVVYQFDGVTKPDRYGEWEAYVPGPRQVAPWDDQDEGVAFSPDALPEGSVRLAGSGLKLLDAPGG